MKKHSESLQRCPYCSNKFYPREEDVEYINSVKTFYCSMCGEQFSEENMKVNTYGNYVKSEWK